LPRGYTFAACKDVNVSPALRDDSRILKKSQGIELR
jgi:hypothetical protein